MKETRDLIDKIVAATARLDAASVPVDHRMAYDMEEAAGKAAICWQCEGTRWEIVRGETSLTDGMAHLRYQCLACGALQDEIATPAIRPLDGYHPIARRART